jgi:hypothetical protein
MGMQKCQTRAVLAVAFAFAVALAPLVCHSRREPASGVALAVAVICFSLSSVVCFSLSS